VYNVKNQLKELQSNSGINHFTYDKQGNTIKEETSTGNNIFEYNTLNQQVKAITKEGNTLVSRYDAEGLRAEIEENEKLTKFIFHKDNILVEADKDYNVISRFTRGYEVVAADIEDSSARANSEIQSKLNRYFYTVDEQGSTIFITDKNQQVKNEYYYDAFGNVLDAQEQVHNRITYTGQQFDGITGQYYLRARFYNPVIGRFTQEDIYRGDGLNLYAYCGNNPIRYYDPSGYSKKEIPMYETVGQIKARNNGEVAVGIDQHTEVFRVIRPDELANLDKGIIPKDVNNKTLTPEKHVESWRNKTSYNSASINIAKSEKQAIKSGNRIVKIDLKKLPDHQVIVDLSTDDLTKSIRLNGNKKAVDYSANSSEVLIRGKIDPEAVTLLDEDDIKKIKNTDKQKSTIERDYKEKGERLKKNNKGCDGKGRTFK
ncbi:RHS repeat-associated core domain-containing protein, partial [Clostridium saccharoperbutylacetonicum]|uniref:RHS repeat-associated core domain-containing protein n=1 Tax=Clostridium saccharoperbutylacetonicum TaxID=36745 RepID=UPI0039E824C7